MKQNLTFWEILPVGLMLFSSFFGAGNLIFPPALGQAAGDPFLVSCDWLLRYRRRYAAFGYYCYGTN